ncbi:Gpi16 subunit, GPI transamidase component-domain-containing protein [Mycena vulgaris]|nr:Gpi16 subunit, GPI transamidase component-domain-containing protein [Mycena vulgaris]
MHCRIHGIWALCAASVVFGGEKFPGGLIFRILPDGKAASTFSFEIAAHTGMPNYTHDGTSYAYVRTFPNSPTIDHHYIMFPLSLGEIIREYAVTEMYLTLNAGNWDYDRWGPPSEAVVGTGPELWAWIGNDGAQDILVPSQAENHWRGLRNSLAGLFCASLGASDDHRTNSPTFAFPQTSDRSRDSSADRGLRHAMRHLAWPSENVCTENWTRFLKLLPCKTSSGIASLLNPHTLFDADWHGMGLHVWKTEEEFVLRLTVQALSDPLCLPLAELKWSFLFGRVIASTYPLSASSNVELELPLKFDYSLSPEPSFIKDGRAIFEVLKRTPLDISLGAASNLPLSLRSATQTINAKRTLYGSGQALGQVFVIIANQEVREVQRSTWKPCRGLFNYTFTHYALPSTAIDEAVLTLPARTTTRLTFDVKKAFLRYSEHPPDTQHGWDLPPAILIPLRTTIAQSAGNLSGNRIYMRTLLVDLATPDFCMPYKVILLSSIVVAYIFTGVMNILTAKFAFVL